MILSNKSLHGTEIKIFSCNSNMKLAQDICDILGQPMGRSDVTKFSDGEISVSLKEFSLPAIPSTITSWKC